MSTQVTFYAVNSDGVLEWATKLIESAFKKQRRVLIFCSTSEDAASMDEHLWSFQPDSFIPHEVALPDSKPTQPQAPVLITTAETNLNAASILIQLGPSELEFGLEFNHVIELVNRADEAQLAKSRERFKAWKELSKGHDVKVEFKG